MDFQIDDSIWSLYPELHIGVVVARGIDNTAAQAEPMAARLMQQVAQSAQELGDHDIAVHPAITPWREAYRAFGAKPAKYRSSIESLLRSTRAGSLRSINPLVDLYNTISLKHKLPCGGEDLATISGSIRLTRAAGNEDFIPLGSDEQQPPEAGEVIYRDDIGVICRCFNWREADRSKLTERTTDAVLFIECLTADKAAVVQSACIELALRIERHLGGQTPLIVLNATQPAVDLSALR